jgi:hypothetical protein
LIPENSEEEKYPKKDKNGEYKIVELSAPRKTEYGIMYTLQIKSKKIT